MSTVSRTIGFPLSSAAVVGSVAVCVATAAGAIALWRKRSLTKPEPTKPTNATPTPQLASLRSVNYHITRQCNYRCEHCFHTAKTSHIVTLDEAKRGLRMLKDHGMKKINFAGGEPFLKKEFLGQLCRFCKEELGLVVSVVTNGSLVTEEWLREYSTCLDYAAVSIDSADDDINREIGREDRSSQDAHRMVAERALRLFHKYGVRLRINTVVCSVNKDDDMTSFLHPIVRPLGVERWKVFQMLLIDGENTGKATDSKRDARELVVTDAEFRAYIKRHAAFNPIPEDNSTMRNSYVLVDEYLRFLDNSGGSKKPSQSILTVGVKAAFAGVGFDADAFTRRQGDYFEAPSNHPAPAARAAMRDIEDCI